MAKTTKIETTTLVQVVLVATIVVLVFVILRNLTQSKEKFAGLSFPNPREDNRIRDKKKRECREKGGRWHRGGDLFSAWIWGNNSKCVDVKFREGRRPNATAGYCCHSGNMTMFDENADYD